MMVARITSYNVCYTKLLRVPLDFRGAMLGVRIFMAAEAERVSHATKLLRGRSGVGTMAGGALAVLDRDVDGPLLRERVVALEADLVGFEQLPAGREVGIVAGGALPVGHRDMDVPFSLVSPCLLV